MPKKYLRIILVIAIAVVFLQIAHPAFALEVTYPNITGAPANGPQAGGGGVSVVSYVSYVFLFIVGAAGLIAVGTIVYSGLQILLAGGSSGAISAARERIWGCVLGIALLLFSFILLRTINPQLISQSNVTLGFPAGNNLYYTYVSAPDANGVSATTWTQAPQSVDNTAPIVTEGYTNLLYRCDGDNKKILLWAYNDTGQQIDFARNGLDYNMQTHILNCGDTIVLNEHDYPIKSFSWAYEEPGVYLYADDNCSGISSYVQKESTAFSSIPYFGQDWMDSESDIGSIRIVSGNVEGRPQRYGFIVKNSDGECSAPFLKTEEGDRCIKVSEDILSDYDSNPFTVSGLYVMLQNPNPWTGHIPRTAIRLRSDDLEKTLTDQDVGVYWSYPGNVNELFNTDNGAVNFTGIDTPEGECQDDTANCLRSIQIEDPQNRFYHTILYSRNQVDDNYTCQVFENSIGTNPGDGTLDNLLRDNKKLYRIDIILR